MAKFDLKDWLQKFEKKSGFAKFSFAFTIFKSTILFQIKFNNNTIFYFYLFKVIFSNPKNNLN